MFLEEQNSPGWEPLVQILEGWVARQTRVSILDSRKLGGQTGSSDHAYIPLRWGMVEEEVTGQEEMGVANGCHECSDGFTSLFTC